MLRLPRLRSPADAEGVCLTITAPEEAAEAADELFAQFAPDLARESA